MIKFGIQIKDEIFKNEQSTIFFFNKICSDNFNFIAFLGFWIQTLKIKSFY